MSDIYTNQNELIDLSNLNPNKILEFSFNYELLKYTLTSLISNQQNIIEELSRLKLSLYKQQKHSGELDLKLIDLKIKGAKSKEELQKLHNEKEQLNLQNTQFIQELESIKNQVNEQIPQKISDIYTTENQKYETLNTKGISEHELISQTSNKISEKEIISEVSNIRNTKGTKSRGTNQDIEEIKEKIENIIQNKDLVTKNDLEDINKKMESFLNDISNINSSIQVLEQDLSTLKTKNNEQNQENLEKNISKKIEEIFENKIKIIKNDINNDINQIKENMENNNLNFEEKITQMNEEITNIDSSTTEKIEKNLEEIKKHNEKIKNIFSIQSEKLSNTVSSTTFNNAKKEIEQKIENEKKFFDDKILEIKNTLSSLKIELSDHVNDTKDKDNIRNIFRIIESLNGNVNNLLEFKKATEDKENRRSMINNNNKFIKQEQFNEGINNLKKLIENNKKEYSQIRLDFSNFRENDFTNKASLKDLKSLEDNIFEKIERLKEIVKDNFVEKNMLAKNLRYIEYQTKHLIEENNKEEKQDNWLLAKKPMNGHLCASCEAYLGDLKPTSTSNYVYWNKYPEKNAGDLDKKIYKVNAGFSNVLQMINQENNNERSKRSSLNLSLEERNISSSQNNNKRKIPNLNVGIKQKVLASSKSFVGIDNYDKGKILPKILEKKKHKLNGHYSTKNKTIRNSETSNNTQRINEFYENLKELDEIQQNENGAEMPKITKIFKIKEYTQEKTQ